jgi:hypothetical protein
MLRGQFIVAGAAIYLLLVGGLCLFLPAQVGAQFGAGGANAPLLPIQVLGCACLGLGLLDWVSRRSMVGGIYGRPLVIGNLVHFVCGALVFARSLMDSQAAAALIGLTVFRGSLSRLGRCCLAAGRLMRRRTSGCSGARFLVAFKSARLKALFILPSFQ